MSEPSLVRMQFNLSATGNSDNFVDLSQCASILNRRFYRQGLNWVVSNVELISDGGVTLNIAKLPDSWVMANSWVKSFEIWRESQAQVLEVDGKSIIPPYHDFKIFMDSNHEVATVANNLIPSGYLIAAGTAAYDWEAIDIQIPNDPVAGVTTGYNVHAIGPSTATSKGMIAGYAASRSRPQQEEPNVVSSTSTESWMRDAFDTGDNLEEIRADIEFENDQPPYLVAPSGSINEYYPGGSIQASTLDHFIQDTLVTRAGTSLAFDQTGSFMAPCGLLRLNTGALDWPGVSFVTVYITLAPGPVKGLLAQPMQEMN